MSHTARAIPWMEILGKVGAVGGLVAAWLLLTGWAYAYAYFYEFGIGVSAVQLDARLLPLYGFLSAREFWLPLLGGALGTVAALWLSRRLLGDLPANLVLAAAGLALAAIFALGYVIGAAKADRVFAELRAADWPGFRRVEVFVRPDWSGDARLAMLAEDLAEGCYRMIFAGGSSVFVFRPLRGQSALVPPVAVLDRSTIGAMRLRAEQTSCAA